MKAIKSVFVWIKSLVLLILALPFLIVGAVGLGVALCGVLFGAIGVVLVGLAGITKIKIDAAGIKKAIEEAAAK